MSVNEVVQYFNRFYTLAIKQHLLDPLINSQWAYFLSMFKGTFERDRLELYLGILANQRERINDKDKYTKMQSKNTSPNQYEVSDFINTLKEKYEAKSLKVQIPERDQFSNRNNSRLEKYNALQPSYSPPFIKTPIQIELERRYSDSNQQKTNGIAKQSTTAKNNRINRQNFEQNNPNILKPIQKMNVDGHKLSQNDYNRKNLKEQKILKLTIAVQNLTSLFERNKFK